MSDAQSQRRIAAAWWATLFLAVIVVLALFLKHQGIDLGGTYAVIVVAPIVVFLALSGDVSELAGIGGFSAKFRENAKAPVDSTAEIEEPQFIQKGRVAPLLIRLPQLRYGKPVALSLRLGDPSAGYTSDDIETYLTSLMAVDPQLTVILVDLQRKFVASTNGGRIIPVVRDMRLGNDFVEALLAADLPAIRNLVALTTSSISKKDSNASALKLMMEDDVSAIVAIDDQRYATGVVRRDRIIAKLIVSLAT